MINSKHINKITAIWICVSILASMFIVFAAYETKAAYVPEYQKRLFNGEVITVDIQVDETEWNDMMRNASAREYIMANVVINGIKVQSVGVRTKGNASLSQVSQSGSPERYSLRITFGEYVKKQTYYGLDSLVLNNIISDSTYMKEYMSQDIMRYIGVESPLTSYASISVNGEPFGLYVALESYGDSYLNRIYGDTAGNLYNVKTMNMGGGIGGGAGGMRNPNAQAAIPETGDWNDRAGFVGRGGGSSGGTLQYTDDNISSYPAIFDNARGTVSEADQQKVVEALKNLSDGTNLEAYFDVDEILRYFAAHTVVVNLDSYYSSMAQNYFIQERNGQISILPWDYHLSYGAFQSGSASDVVNFPIDTPVSGVTMESRPLLDMLLSNEEYLARYHAYLQEIVDGYFNSGLFEETARNIQETIAEYVQNDPSAFYTFEQFETGVDTLINLNMLRAKSITGQLDGTIPSTTDGQKADISSLVDASLLNMSDLGSNGMGGGGDRGDLGNRPDMPGMLGGMPDGMDRTKMQDAMQIIRSAENGELSGEQIEQLHSLGLSDDEIEQMKQMAQRGMGEGLPGGLPDQNAGNGMQNFPYGQDANVSYPASGQISAAGWITIAVLLLLLLEASYLWRYSNEEKCLPDNACSDKVQARIEAHTMSWYNSRK